MAETQKAHTEVPSGGHIAFPPFNRETFASQLFWLAITFAVLYLLMARFALPRVGSIIEARRSKIESDLAAAAQLKSNAEAAMAAYEKALAEARARAQTIGGETRAKLNAEAEEARKKLEAELNTKLAEAEKTIGDTKASAMRNVRGIAAEAAAAIVAKLTGSAPPDRVVSDALDTVLKR
jgi:F-type H+-transporting ATPase subunit b